MSAASLAVKSFNHSLLCHHASVAAVHAAEDRHATVEIPDSGAGDANDKGIRVGGRQRTLGQCESVLTGQDQNPVHPYSCWCLR